MIIENLSIKVEVSPGTDISQACQEATALANHLRLTVDFKFNEVTVMTKPGVDPEELEKAWRYEMESKRPYKFACAHPKR